MRYLVKEDILITSEQALPTATRIAGKVSDYFKANGKSVAVFGMSGGIDSAVTGAILSMAEEVKPLAFIMPCDSHPEDCDLAIEQADELGIPWEIVDLTKDYHSLASHFADDRGMEGELVGMCSRHGLATLPSYGLRRIARGNIKARLRMITLYHAAQLTQGIVISTDNYSELCLGFWTICGDVGDLGPLQFCLKTEVYTMADALPIIKPIKERAPSDGLMVTDENTDEAQIGTDYGGVDTVIEMLEVAGFVPHNLPDNFLKVTTDVMNKCGVGDNTMGVVDKVVKRIIGTSWKRRIPINFTREELEIGSISSDS